MTKIHCLMCIIHINLSVRDEYIFLNAGTLCSELTIHKSLFTLMYTSTLDESNFYIVGRMSMVACFFI